MACAIQKNARQPLSWTTGHPAADPGRGVLLDIDGEQLDGACFQTLRDRYAVSIETDESERVCEALGVSGSESGIIRKQQ
jgi:hypothetical protein